MNIYPVLPYVYMGINKHTNKIYIGSRLSNKVSSIQDFGNIYKTSSKIVKPIFDEFDWSIIAEFFDPKDAYDFEQQLIHEQWQISKEMSLNKRCWYGSKDRFNTYGIKVSEETRRKMINSKLKMTYSTKLKMSESSKGKPKSEEHKRKMSESHKRKMSESHKNIPGRKHSEETRRKMSESAKNRKR